MENGSFDVTELIYVDFLVPRRGIIRNIPFAYKSDGELKEFEIKKKKKKTFRYRILNIKVFRLNPNKGHPYGDPNITLTGIQTYKDQISSEGALRLCRRPYRILLEPHRKSVGIQMLKVNYTIS